MDSGLVFPTDLHREVADVAVGYFAGRPGIDAVLVTASCARGVATPESDLDMVALASGASAEDRRAIEAEWKIFKASSDSIKRLYELSLASALHLDVIDGTFEPVEWDEGGGPDDFEVEIGNHVAYSAPVWEANDAFARLKERWLPYYDDSLRDRRFAMVRHACLHDLDHVPFYVGRGLHFQAFDRLYKAHKEFLQALFISRRTYPIAYWKWIPYQVVDLLGEPELYRELPAVLEVQSIEGDSILRNVAHLRALVDDWL